MHRRRRNEFSWSRVKPREEYVIMTRHRLPKFLACLFFAALLAGPAKAETNIRFLLDWAFQGQQAAFTVPADDGTFQRLGPSGTIGPGVGPGGTGVQDPGGTPETAA